jgi:tetratricopeptide (TPR) repeat protein
MLKTCFIFQALAVLVLVLAANADPKLSVTICLSIMVKSEGIHIPGLLKAAQKLVDCVAVLDTGSIDGTADIFKQWGKENGIPVQIQKSEFKDYGTSRTDLFSFTKQIFPNATYYLILDARQILHLEPDFDKQSLTLDSYTMDQHFGNLKYKNTRLIKASLPWVCKGVVHEYWESPPGAVQGHITKAYVYDNGKGGDRSGKIERYASLLRKGIAELPADAPDTEFLKRRYLFYLANSVKDLGKWQEAIEFYNQRITLGGWYEEVFYSKYSIAQCYNKLGNTTLAIDSFLDAYNYHKKRAEPLYRLALLHAELGQRDKAVDYLVEAKQVTSMPVDDNLLFREADVWEYQLDYQLGIHSYYVEGKKELGRQAILRLINLGSDLHEPIYSWARETGVWYNITNDTQTMVIDDFGVATMDKNVSTSTQYMVNDDEKGVLVSILAKDKEVYLPFYLECLYRQTYPKHKTHLYIRTNNNKDNTVQVLKDWIDKVGHEYASVFFDTSDVSENVQQYGEHEWNSLRVRVLGEIRQKSIQYAMKRGLHYFVADCDNFITCDVIIEMLKTGLPTVGPMLVHETKYSNYHNVASANGYFQENSMYDHILFKKVKGLIDVDVIHCTYFIRNEVLPNISYMDETARYEYVIFSDTLRKQGISQYLDNRKYYGAIVFNEAEFEKVRASTLLPV